MKFAIALSVAATCAFSKPLVEPSITDFQYMQYTALFNKHAHSLHEFETRMHEFAETHKYITAHNAATTNTHFVGHNAYSDWTDDERTHFLSGGLVDTLKDHDHIMHHYARLNTEYIPDRINWVEHGAVGSVKHDFSSCSSSWAHAAIDAIEGDVFLRTNKSVSLSAQ